MTFQIVLSLPVLSRAEGSKHKIDLGDSPLSFDVYIFCQDGPIRAPRHLPSSPR
jgi:hypothetical protein